MTRDLLIDAVPGELRTALLIDDEVIDISIDRDGLRSAIGNIYLGRVYAVEPSLQAAFVRLPDGLPGYLSVKHTGGLKQAGSGATPRRIERLVHEGEAVLVQVTRDARGDKGPALTTHVSFPGRRLVYHPFRDQHVMSSRLRSKDETARLQAIAADLPSPGGYTIRTAAEGASADALLLEAQHLTSAWETLQHDAQAATAPACLWQEPPLARVLRSWADDRIDTIILESPALLAEAKHILGHYAPDLADRISFHTGHPPLFEARGVEDAINGTLEPRIDLPGGGWITIEATEALTAIDINSGSETGEADLEQTAFEINRRAVATIARQLRLRDIGGMIVIDFIHMENKQHVDDLLAALRSTLADDPAPTPVLGMTRMGLCEMTRKRARTSLPDLLTGHAAAHAGIRSVSSTGYDVMRAIRAEAMARPGLHVAVDAPGAVIDWLSAGARPDQLEQLAGSPVLLQSRDDLHDDRYEVYGVERHD
ncbi:MAG: Rne/Rng family ribonuclease [Alphaproteobacteria bacterium]